MATNAFSQLFSGLSPNLNTPKFNFMQNYGANNSPAPVGPMSIASKPINQSIPASNTGATAPVKSTALSTPAAKQFVASQASAPDYTHGGTTPGGAVYDSTGHLTSVPGQSSTTTQPITGNTQTPSGATVNADTGTVVTPPATDPKAAYGAAYQSYIQSLTPSSDVTAATAKLNADTLQSKKDQEEALNRGETLGFASGEAARVNRNNAFQTEADTNTLTALTGQSTARTNASKAQLDYEKSLLPSTDTFSLSPGETRYDASGKQIATAAPKALTPSDQYGTGAIGEYNFAKSQGYKGTFSDYQNEDANRNARAVAQPKSLTEAQTKSQGYALINQLAGKANAQGVPFVDQNGYFTPEGFKDIVANAAEDGLSRADILAEYADKIYPGAAAKYRLTPKEKTDLGIE